jgi:hypothetical protein
MMQGLHVFYMTTPTLAPNSANRVPQCGEFLRNAEKFLGRLYVSGIFAGRFAEKTDGDGLDTYAWPAYFPKLTAEFR